MRLESVLELDLGQPVRQLRAAPVSLGAGGQRGIALVYSAERNVDPFTEYFFFPQHTLKLALATLEGEVLWRRDLGRGVVPGTWFCPVFPFDLDGDGVDELWLVNNPDAERPLAVSRYRLERMDPRTGAVTGEWPWPNYGTFAQPLSQLFRNFIFGGHVHGEPVLVTAQGTYGAMFLQAHKPGAGGALEPRWEVRIPREAPGARGAHTSAISDLDADGVQEVLWGERCIELDQGRELFCAGRDTWSGHSDVAQPFYHHASGRRFLYTCREQQQEVAPRVALFDSRGERVWGDVDRGHLHTGWIARLGHDAANRDAGLVEDVAGAEGEGEYVAMAVRIGRSTQGGTVREVADEFAWDALTGTPRRLPFRTYGTVPVDLNGDGFHEIAASKGEVLDRFGREVGNTGGAVAMASRFMDLPGEQLLIHSEDGMVRVWADRDAQDSDYATRRFAQPEYRANQRLSAVGYGRLLLTGL